MPALSAHELLSSPAGESTDSIRSRCHQARARAVARQGLPNQSLNGNAIDEHTRLDPAGAKFLQSAAAQLGWSARSTHRTLKIARTIADLAGTQDTGMAHVAEAMQYRRVLRTAT